MHLIVTHENADFDAIASLLGASKLFPKAIALLPDRLNRNVAAFLTLYRAAFAFATRADVYGDKRPPRLTGITVVDTRRPPGLKGLKSTTPITIIDHHPNDGIFAANETFEGELLGANTTLLVERMMRHELTLTSLETTLLALGIYEDTGALTYRGTTARDARAAAWLIEQGAVLDTVRKYLEPPLNDEQQAILEQLVHVAETRMIQGYPVTVAWLKVDRYIAELSAITHRLRDTLDPAALFVLVDMPLERGGERTPDNRRITHLVCRSTDDAIDAGEIAKAFNGGGHVRAASAPIADPPALDTLVAQVWELVELRVRPAVRVADLMSFGAQTVTAHASIGKIAQRLRRLGHEGFPVVENGHVVGLLTRRQVDRALDHEMVDLTVRDVMTAGQVTLRSDAPAALLERTMVESGWGQVPVVDDHGKVIGIVTRTDLLKHWRSTHPTPELTAAEAGSADDRSISRAQVTAGLGAEAESLIGAIAKHAADKGETVYLVGGVVRDLLLKRGSFDLDFVVESTEDGAAIRFADTLGARYGGQVTSFKPFGTAKWKIDASVGTTLGIDAARLPDHVDFAAARSEFYEYPTALPTTYAGGIKLDLARRDFSINALAIQLNDGRGLAPNAERADDGYRLIDEFGGVRDLRDGVIRVLHSLSFIDDPTRILRASRFEHRFGFRIEPRTMELLRAAFPMLRRTTGERVRNELTLLLKEREPERAFEVLQERGVLAAIYPAFQYPAKCSAVFQRAQALLSQPEQIPAWAAPLPPTEMLYWHLIAAFTPLAVLPEACERLLFGKTLADSLIDTAQMVQNPGVLADPNAPPSQITAYLENKILDVQGSTALLAAWLCVDDAIVRARIDQFAREWRHLKPASTGETLKKRGLKPGRCYGIILTRLRAARLDGDVTDDDAETRLLQDLIDKGICNDGA
ncbi:MAG: CBS domain-containing protein [Anaerolineae bacterium]